jgi:hypothetical protein
MCYSTTVLWPSWVSKNKVSRLRALHPKEYSILNEQNWYGNVLMWLEILLVQCDILCWRRLELYWDIVRYVVKMAWLVWYYIRFEITHVPRIGRAVHLCGFILYWFVKVLLCFDNFFPIYFQGFLCICTSVAPQRRTRYCVIPGGYPPQDWQSLPCAGEELDLNPGLLNCSQVRYHWATSPPIHFPIQEFLLFLSLYWTSLV